MNNLKSAAKLALEALECLSGEAWNSSEVQGKMADEAIKALEEALAKQEQCKYGQEPKSCTSNPMDCQCAIDAALDETGGKVHEAVAYQPNDEELFKAFTPSNKGPNPFYRCNTCGDTEPGVREYLVAHWLKHNTHPPELAATETGVNMLEDDGCYHMSLENDIRQTVGVERVRDNNIIECYEAVALRAAMAEAKACFEELGANGGKAATHAVNTISYIRSALHIYFELAATARQVEVLTGEKQEQGEPVKSVGDFSDWLVLPPAEQQRTWVGLTNNEIEDFLSMFFTGDEQIKAVEAKLREKNGMTQQEGSEG